MLTKIKKNYIINKLKLSIKIKKIIKNTLLLSMVKNKNLKNSFRLSFLVKYHLSNKNKTHILDVCLKSSMFRKSNKNTNLSRYEFHKSCRLNKAINWSVNSW